MKHEHFSFEYRSRVIPDSSFLQQTARKEVGQPRGAADCDDRDLHATRSHLRFVKINLTLVRFILTSCLAKSVSVIFLPGESCTLRLYAVPLATKYRVRMLALSRSTVDKAYNLFDSDQLDWPLSCKPATGAWWRSSSLAIGWSSIPDREQSLFPH